MGEAPLARKAILIVEDEYYAADDLRRELVRVGARVLGPVPSLNAAIDVIETCERIDGAILDVNLGGKMVFPVADLLAGRRVPFLFATGYDQMMIPSRFDGVARCEKPVGPDKVRAALMAAVSGGTTR